MISITQKPQGLPCKAEDYELCGEYLLGGLVGEEKKQFELRLEQEPKLQQCLNQWQTYFLPLNDALPAIHPSEHLKVRLQRSIDHAYQQIQPQATVITPQPAWWRSVRTLQGVALAAVFSTVSISYSLFQAQQLQSQSRVPAYMAVLMTPETKTANWIIQASNQPNELVLIPMGEIQIPTGKALEIWANADDWSKPISLGLVQNANDLHSMKVSLPELPKTQKPLAFILTVEPAQGSPTGLPTGPIESLGNKVTVF